MLSAILTAIIGGIILGVLARFILPGRQNISMTVTIIAGVAAALVGTLIARSVGLSDTKGIDWWEHLIQLGLAIAAISFAAAKFPRKNTGTPHSPTRM